VRPSSFPFLLAIIATMGSCKTPMLDLFGVDRGGVCADATILDDGGAFACDDKGQLVACAGKRALGKHGGLNVCTQADDAGFMLVCTKGVGASTFEVELLPCAHCNAKTPDGANLGVVDFDMSACRLPELPVYDAGSLQDVVEDVPDAGFLDETDAGEHVDGGDGDVDAGVEEFKPCPCDDESMRCDEDLGVCVHLE
jgi:hypothetical protein